MLFFLPLLVYHKDSIQRVLGDDFFEQIRIFELVDNVPELAEMKLRFIDDKKKIINSDLNNIKSWG